MAAEYKDYYKILGVDKTTDEKDIKSAYRKLARKHHPDVNQNDKQAEERFKDISEAYDVLSDPDKRAKYDQYGDQWKNFTQTPGGGDFSSFRQAGGRPTSGRPDASYGGGGLDDLFSTLFGGTEGGFSGFSGGARRPQPRQQEFEYPVEISFAEAYAGATRSFTMSLPETCPRCHGAGSIPAGKSKSLFNAGQQPAEICPECHGQGSVERQKRLSDVRIPAGVKEGQRIRLAAQGPDGADIYLKVSVRQDPKYERKEDDLYTDFELPYTVAALGGEASVTTLDGRKRLNVPAGTQTGQSFRLTGLGMPHVRGGGKGNLYARASITVPKQPSGRERELLKQIAELAGEVPQNGS